MTSPRVIELPRRLEPVVRDTFLGGPEADAAADRRMADVVALRVPDPRDRDPRPTSPAAA